MNIKALFLISALSLGVAACGGGGGGGGGTTAPEIPSYKGDKTPAGTPVLPELTKQQRAGYLSILSEDDGDLPVEPKSMSELNKGRAGLGASYENLNDERIFMGGVSYVGKDGNTYSTYGIDDNALKGIPTSPSGNHTWTDVLYYQTAAHKDGRIAVTSEAQSDGTITVNGSNWDAKFGDVTLDGTINGTDVSGKATGKFFGETVPGGFAGKDANIGDAGDHGSVGGFAGNNEDISFAGGWLTDENSTFTQ